MKYMKKIDKEVLLLEKKIQLKINELKNTFSNEKKIKKNI